MPATIRYNTLRFVMVLVTGAVCYLLGARGLLLIILAFFISLPLSFVLLARWRRAMIDEFASGKADKVNPARAIRAINDKIESNKVAEDAIVDQELEGPGPDQKV